MGTAAPASSSLQTPDTTRRPLGWRRQRCLADVLMLAATAGSYGWGAVGRAVVCQIAYLELTPKAKAMGDGLMSKDSRHQTFPEVCNWADEPAQRSKRRMEHFINVPRFWHEIRGEECRIADRCSFSAIRHDVNVLSSDIEDASRLESLKYLGHWIGDIHQPLLVSFDDDLGGNAIKEGGRPCDGGLHAMWDGCIIK